MQGQSNNDAVSSDYNWLNDVSAQGAQSSQMQRMISINSDDIRLS